MALEPGTRLGPYEVLAQIGAGGMGEVYKGRDTRLDRLVALKLLAPHLAANREARERFEREATTVAKLKHAHICLLYDIGKDQGRDYLVFEYLEGETLSQRLARGPLPLDLVLQYSIEIADALDKAHRAGVTHRDIKPGNIMIVPSSEAASKTETKLLDFGLAKLKQAALPADIANLPRYEWPTGAGAPTAQGTVLGTAQYMAPEQVEGKVDELDARTDIFAFGAVVYEMVTGKKAFEGKSPTSVAAKILEHDPPPMSTLQPMSPRSLDRVVKQCLAKEPDDRWQTAADLCRELKWIATGGGQAVGVEVQGGKLAVKPWQRALPWAAAVVALLVGIAIGAWMLRPSSTAVQAPAHLTITLPPGDRLAAREYPPLALSPDGSNLVYAAIRNDVQQLYLRAIDSREAKLLPGTEGAASPFFSPDGQWVGFFADGKLKKVSIAGGALQIVCDSAANGGASWGADGTIVFASSYASGLSRVSAAGGTPEVLTTLDPSKGELSHRWPQFLPGGQALLFTVQTGPGWDLIHAAVLRFDTGELRIVQRGALTGRFVPTGHLVYDRAGTLLAVPFDLARLEVTSGTPVTIAEGVKQSDNTLGSEYSFADAGSLAYVPASPRQFERRLVWVDRNGEVEPFPAPPRHYLDMDFSPDGRQLAVSIEGNTSETWIYDLARGTLTRFTSEAGGSRGTIWTPDGKRIAYQAARAGFRNVFWKATDGTGGEERLTTGEYAQTPSSWSPDGKWLTFFEMNPTTGADIWGLRLDGGPGPPAPASQGGGAEARKPQPLIRTPFNQYGGLISPDGRWLAYSSDESGRQEIYVQPFPGLVTPTPEGSQAQGGKWQISTEGGGGDENWPNWARNGREIFYRIGDKMMAVDITTEPTFTAGRPRLLFQGQYQNYWDVAPDGQRFLMIQPVEPEQPATQIHVVLNWFEELKRRVPTGR